MLRNYTLQKQILNQYITKDKHQNRNQPTIIVENTYKKSKYNRKVMTNDQMVQKQYGLTKRQLDTLIQQMAETYNYQWKVVSNALFKEHNIMISDRALNFRYYKLHPRNEKWGYSEEESKQLLRMFYLEGKRYKQINNRFGYRGQHSIRNALYSFSYKGFSKLQYYLRDQIMQMDKQLVIDKKKSRKAFLLQTLILNYGLKWDYNKHTLSLFYYFMMATQEQIKTIPKELAMLLYKRFIEMIDEKRQQKKEMYEMIKPNLYQELQLVKQQRNRLCANMFRIINKQKSKQDQQYSQLDYNQYGSFIRKIPLDKDDENRIEMADLQELRVFSQEEQQLIMNHFNDQEQSNIEHLLADIHHNQQYLQEQSNIQPQTNYQNRENNYNSDINESCKDSIKVPFNNQEKLSSSLPQQQNR